MLLVRSYRTFAPLPNRTISDSPGVFPQDQRIAQLAVCFCGTLLTITRTGRYPAGLVFREPGLSSDGQWCCLQPHRRPQPPRLHSLSFSLSRLWRSARKILPAESCPQNPARRIPPAESCRQSPIRRINLGKTLEIVPQHPKHMAMFKQLHQIGSNFALVCFLVQDLDRHGGGKAAFVGAIGSGEGVVDVGDRHQL